jgi:hypothetical protein
MLQPASDSSVLYVVRLQAQLLGSLLHAAGVAEQQMVL